MKIYSQEKKDGLGEILQNRSIAYTNLAEPTQPFSLKNIHLTRGTNENQIDLYYLKTLLVSTGWNKNDDVFDTEETWLARKTPEDKPFNYEHDQSDIIGHITSNVTVNDALKPIDDSSAVDDVPDKFHIVTGAVLYKNLENADRQERILKIIAEIEDNKWFVSMEALFSDFDYAIIKGGEHSVIGRTAQSSFLTKHLRAYGGDGKYQDMKIGRLLKNITFSGKGLVKKPANPESVIFNDATIFKAKSKDFNLLVYSSEEEKIMADTKDKTEELLEEKVKLMSDKNVLETQNASLKKDGESKDTEIVNLKKVVADKDGEIKVLKASIEEINKKIESVTADLTKAQEATKKAETDNAKLNEEMNKVRAEQLKQKRINTIINELEYNQKDAEDFVNEFAELNDVLFTKAVDKIKAVKTLVMPGKKDNKKQLETYTSDTKTSNVKINKGKASEETLEVEDEEPNPSLATASDDEFETLKNEIGDFLKGDN